MIFIYVPCQNLNTAKIIAKILVEKRMAGKVDIIATNSFTRVEDLSNQAGEVAEISGATLIIMTIDKHVQGIEDVVREYYQDGIPCMATIALYRLNRDFKDWLIGVTG